MQEQSNKQFYISDWHYGHANVIAFKTKGVVTCDLP